MKRDAILNEIKNLHNVILTLANLHLGQKFNQAKTDKLNTSTFSVLATDSDFR